LAATNAEYIKKEVEIYNQKSPTKTINGFTSLLCLYAVYTSSRIAAHTSQLTYIMLLVPFAYRRSKVETKKLKS